MFYLMNKNNKVLEFDITKGIDYIAVVHAVFDKYPYGCNESCLTGWLNRRHASKHRKHLTEYLDYVCANDLLGFIKLTHSISINDTYWVKEDREYLTWEDISPYSNNFDEAISRLAFDGTGLYGVQISSTSPEFGTTGAYEKCWVRECNSIYLYKRGTEGFRNAGLEPYSEHLASQVFKALNAGIPYDIVNYRGKIASKCKLFTDDDIGYVPYSLLGNSIDSPDAILNFFERIDSGEAFRRMLVCDSIVFNTDRHMDNYGCLFDTNTLELKGMSPCFDYNLALFPMEERDAFADINSLTAKYVPKIGHDFVSIAKAVLTSNIRSDLVNLKGFEYGYVGDDKFTKERVDWLSSISNQQINHILGKSDVVFYTNPNVSNVSNLYKYRLKYRLSEEEFNADVPRLCKLLGVEHVSDLEERIVDLL